MKRKKKAKVLEQTTAVFVSPLNDNSVIQGQEPKRYPQRTQEEHAEIRKTYKVLPRTCNHQKGGRLQSEGHTPDYNLSLHVFIDNTSRIRCNQCAFKWYKGDTKDLIIRSGTSYENPTRLSWEDVYELATKKSTNQWSSSERIVSGTSLPPNIDPKDDSLIRASFTQEEFDIIVEALKVAQKPGLVQDLVNAIKFKKNLTFNCN